MLFFFPRDVLDEIWDLIESVSEGFLPTVKFDERRYCHDVIYISPLFQVNYELIAVASSWLSVLMI